MARKFSGAARARGFQPINVSDANISRMRENNQRILDGMRARRESIRRNDERQLQAMQENAKYSAKTRQRDYDIGAQNLRTERQQVEYDAQARTQEIQNQQAGIDAVTSAVSKFSSTLLDLEKKKIEAKEKQAEELAYSDYAYSTTSEDLTPEQAAFDNAVRVEDEARVSLEGTLQVSEAQGAPASEVAEARVTGLRQSASYKRTMLKLAAQTETMARIETIVRENPEIARDPDRLMSLFKRDNIDFIEEKGYSISQRELIAPATKEIVRIQREYIAGVVAKKTEEDNAQSVINATNLAIGDWDNQGISAFQTVSGVKGFPGGHDWFKELATTQDENGEFLLSEAQVLSFDPYGTDKPYVVLGKGTGQFERRGLDILNTRADLKRQWQTNQNTTDRQAYQEESKAWHNHIVVQGNSTPEDIAAAVESFKDDVKGIPEWLRKLRSAGGADQGEYNTNLIATARDLEARGMLEQGIVDKVYERDPKIANELQKSLDEQDPLMNNDSYKDLHKIVGKLNSQKDQFGNYPEDNISSYNNSKQLQKNFKELVKNGVANGSSVEDSSTAAGKIIESGFKDPASPYYRQYNPTTGFYEFPNLYTKTAKEAADELIQANTAFAKNLASGNVQNLFSDPNVIFTDAEFDQELVRMAKPGYNYNTKLSLVAERINGTEMEALQKVAELKGRPPIEPPPSLRQVMDYPPAAKALLNRFQSANRNARGHGQGMSFIGTGWNEGAVPANLREFYRASAERHGISPAENSAMGEIESNHGQYRVSYNGTSYGVMQINRSAHPAFFAQHAGNPSDEANIDYGTAYYANLKKQYNNDPIVAAMAYNGGPGTYNMWLAGQTPDWVKTEVDRAEWDRIVNEMLNHGRKFATALYKYSGDKSVLQHPSIQRN